MTVDGVQEERPTKARMRVLKSQLEAAERRYVSVQQDLRTSEDLRKVAEEQLRRMDVEALAIARCVEVLNDLRFGYVYDTTTPAEQRSAAEMPIGRILLHLAARFGVPL